MTSYQEFSAQSIEQALDTARMHNEIVGVTTADGSPNIAGGGEFSVLAECATVTVSGGRVCLNLPLGIGQVCIPIPISFPDGTVAKACLSICSTWGIPTGVQVTVSVAGQTGGRQSLGRC